MLQASDLDWDLVRRRVTEYNLPSNAYYWSDNALHQAFQGRLTRDRVPLCILAVNHFFGANVEKDAGALEELCERIANDLPAITRELTRANIPLTAVPFCAIFSA
jgi:hypothetical protein